MSVPQNAPPRWRRREREKFIYEWLKQGYPSPPNNWARGEVQIHHIKPLRFGGSNDFDNLTLLPEEPYRNFVRYWDNR